MQIEDPALRAKGLAERLPQEFGEQDDDEE